MLLPIHMEHSQSGTTPKLRVVPSREGDLRPKYGKDWP